MSSLWPWLVVAGLGALHGLNPAGGWLFAAAWGMRSRDRAQALRALVPIAAGHAASVALVAGAMVFGLAMDRFALQILAGGLLAVATVVHLSGRTPKVARACGARRAGALVLHDVHRARRWLDTGAGTDSALRRRRIGSGDGRIGTADAGARGGRDSHCGDARRHRHDRHRSLPWL
ncbi:hypothetical protein LP416_26020 [Polaromonas sp. P2-4]|nr:hypothetical protein LP416_26020 [Polaromonas sp. P2-4]